ncbi:hypothetical protein F0562_011232 [Nyssa sinensis]|uniref:Uncharacterized protein n=1 Tax=Nyssa sinensis TaxID=561372 RepID=A0A5J5A3E1_9ASTE|nr:hypothetical protein F0562_011232 [Nyssa sinensis]
MDEPLLSPGTSERQPLHVVMVDPKVSNRSSRFAQELILTIVFTIAIGLLWLMGAAVLQKYIGSLGGIGTSGCEKYQIKDFELDIVVSQAFLAAVSLLCLLCKYGFRKFLFVDREPAQAGGTTGTKAGFVGCRVSALRFVQDWELAQAGRTTSTKAT